MARIGIPRALLYYSLGSLWQSFFELLGHEVIVSPPTTRSILDEGVKCCNSHCCLPVKVGFGHAAHLAGRVDFVFFPRLVSIEKGCYICPAFMGLPEMLRAALPDLPPLIGGDADGYLGGDANLSALWGAAKALGHRATQTRSAYAQALQAQASDPAWARALPVANWNSSTNAVGVLGHPYNTYDGFISMNLLERLASAGIAPVTCEMLCETSVNQGLEGVSRDIFWTIGRRLVGAARSMADVAAVSGIIHLTSFGCGPDSFTGQMISDYCAMRGMPFIELTLDEHTGEAGVATRVEAFADMLGMECLL